MAPTSRRIALSLDINDLLAGYHTHRTQSLNIPLKNWLHRRLLEPLLALLRAGLSPRRLALCIAIAIVVGNIPILGVSTILCAFIALIFRLNFPAIQLVQAAMAPSQLLLIIPFVRLGEWMLGAPRQIVSVKAGLALLSQGVWQDDCGAARGYFACGARLDLDRAVLHLSAASPIDTCFRADGRADTPAANRLVDAIYLSPIATSRGNEKIMVNRERRLLTGSCIFAMACIVSGLDRAGDSRRAKREIHAVGFRSATRHKRSSDIHREGLRLFGWKPIAGTALVRRPSRRPRASS